MMFERYQLQVDDEVDYHRKLFKGGGMGGRLPANVATAWYNTSSNASKSKSQSQKSDAKPKLVKRAQSFQDSEMSSFK